MDIDLNIKTTAGKIADEFKKLYENLNKNADSQKKLQKENEKHQKLAEKILKDTIKLNDAYKKGQLEAKKYTKEINELSKAFEEDKVDIDEVIKKTEELSKGLAAGTISAAQAGAEFKKLAASCEGSATKAQKVHAAFAKLKSAANALIPDATKLGAILGVSMTLSFEHLAAKAAEFGKTIIQVKQYAAATGQDFGKLNQAIEEIGKTTNLSRQEAAKFVLTFQKNIEGTRLQSDVLVKLSKTMSDAGIDFETMSEQQSNLIAIQNQAPGSIQKLMDSYKDKGAIDNYVNTLMNQYHVSQQSADQFRVLATAMREGNAAADAGPTSKLKDAMVQLKKAAEDLEMAFAEKLAPALTWVAEKLKAVMDWVAQAPAWVIWAGIISGVVATALIGLAGFLLSAALAATSLMGAIEGLGVAFGGAALAGAPLTVSLGAITTGLGAMATAAWATATAVAAALAPFVLIAIAIERVYAIGKAIYEWYETTKKAKEEIEATSKALESAKQRLASKGISGFEDEQKSLEKMKKDYNDLIKMTGKRDMDREAAIDKAEQDLNKKMQDKYKDNLKSGNFNEGSGAASKEAGAITAAAKAESDRKTTMLEQTQILSNQLKDLKAVEELQGAINQAQKAQYEYLLKYENDIPGAIEANDAIVGSLRAQLVEQNKILKTAETQLAIDKDNPGAKMAQAHALEAIKKLDTEINQANMERTHIYDEQKSAIDSNIKLAEDDLALSKELYLGLAPSLEAQQKAVDLYNEKLMLVEKEIAAAKRLAAERPKDLQALKNLRDLQDEKKNIQLKELQITKNLREGYLDAMGAFTNVEGAFSKIIIKKDVAFGEAMRQYKIQGGLRTGQLGAGSDVALAKRDNQTRQLDIASEETTKKVTAGYIKGQPGADILEGGAGVIQQARAAKDAGLEQIPTGNGSQLGAGTNTNRKRGGETTTQPDIGGAAGGAMSPAAPANAVGAIDQLNKDMAARVTEGINNSALAKQGVMVQGAGGGKGGEDLEARRIANLKAQNQGAAYSKGAAENIDKAQQEHNQKMQDAFATVTKTSAEAAKAIASGDPAAAKKAADAATMAAAQAGMGAKTGIPTGQAGTEGGGYFRDQSVFGKGELIKDTDRMKAPLPGPVDDVDDSKKAKYQKMVDDKRKENEMTQKSWEAYRAANRPGGGKGTTTGGGFGGLVATREKNGMIQGQGLAMGDARAANDKAQARIEGTDKMSPENKKKYDAAQKELERYKGNVGRDIGRLSAKGGDTEENKKALKYDQDKVKEQTKILDDIRKTSEKTTKHAEDTSKATQATAKVAEKGDKQSQQAQQGGALNALDAGAIGMGPMNGMSMFGMGGGSGPLGLDMGNKATDFGLGKALGMGSGDSFGAAMFGMATGGMVPGQGDGDKIPALLESGEHIIPKGQARKNRALLDAITKNKFALGGVVGPNPAVARASGGGGGMPNISLNVRGESVNKIMKSVHGQLSGQLNKMMAPNGTTGRFFELAQS